MDCKGTSEVFVLHGSHFQKSRQSSLKSGDKVSVPKKGHTEQQEYTLNLRKPKSS